MGERLPSPFYHKLLLEDEGVVLYSIRLMLNYYGKTKKQRQIHHGK